MEQSDFKRHISRRFNAELEDVRDKLLVMGGLVEKQLSDALRALVEMDGTLGNRVAEDDTKVNAMEVDIDDECIKVLAMRQPAASDLRMLTVVLKSVPDLERMGDKAAQIGRLVAHMAERNQPRNQLTEVIHLGEHVKGMLHKALNAYARLDVDEAFAVIREDARADEEYEAVMRHLLTFMIEDPRQTSHILDILFCARALERVGDHAKNICEYLVFMVEGKDIRHISLELAEEEVHR